MKLSQLITKLKYEITPKEWELLEARDSTIKISEHNRKTLLEMKNTQITKDKEGMELKEFGNTHIKDNMIFIPQIDAYIDLR